MKTSNLKIHTNLKWATIVDRANKKLGEIKKHVYRFRLDSAYRKIYIYSEQHQAYLFASSMLDKEDFIRAYELNLI